MNKSVIRENKGILFVLFGIFVLMLILNSMTPLFADDYFYLLNLQTEKPIETFGDILVSISGFRSMHNGRIAAHFFAQLFLWLPKAVFVAVNSAMCTALMFLVFRFVKSGDRLKDAILTACAFAMIWVLMMGFGHAMLWRTGACSYLWAAVFLVAFIYPFFSCYQYGGDNGSGKISALIGIAFSFFAGSYSESGAFSALAIAFCFLALIFFREHKLPIGLLLRFASACAGFLWLMLAPSELGKKNVNADSQTLEQLGKIGISPKLVFVAAVALAIATVAIIWALRKNRRLFCKLAAFLAAAAMLSVLVLSAFDLEESVGLFAKLNALMSETLLGLALLFGSYGLILCLYLAQNDIDMKLALTALVFGLGALASVAVFLVADYFPARASCVTTVYLTIANMLLMSAMYKNRAFKVSSMIILLLFIPTLIAGCLDIVAVHNQYRQRKEIIAQAQADGTDTMNLEPLLAQGKYAVCWQGEAADYLGAMEVYYGIAGINIENAEEW